jgi:TQO small subunit DoxD
MVGVNPYSEFYGALIVMSRKKPKEASLRDSGAGKGLFIRGLLEDNKREEIFSGIPVGSGWLGTTRVDEWQLGVLGLAAGFTLMLTSGGRLARPPNSGGTAKKLYSVLHLELRPTDPVVWRRRPHRRLLFENYARLGIKTV